MTATIGIVYGTDTGNTEEVGERLEQRFQQAGYDVDKLNVTEASAPVLASYDLLVMGIPTWDFGGIQQDWEEFEQELLATDLSGSAVALYGLGDQFGYGDFFVDAMGWLYQRVLKAKGRVIGFWPTTGYDFSGSLAKIEGKELFCGLAIDEDQQFELTDTRLDQWVSQVLAEFCEAKKQLEKINSATG